MYKVLGADRREYGPISVEQLKYWIAEGRVNHDSLARPEGAAQWQPLASYPDFYEVFGAPAETVPPLPPAAPPTADELTSHLLAGIQRVDIGDCLRAGFSFFAANAGFVIGGVFLNWLAGMIIGFVPFGRLILGGVLEGGLLLAVVRRMRGESAPVADVFSGFKQGFVQLMLAGAVVSVLQGFAWLIVLPGIYLSVAWIFAVPLVADKRFEFWSAMELSRKVVTRVWFEMAILLLVTFVPYILAQCYVGLSMMQSIRAAFASGSFDINTIMQLFKTMATLSLVAKVAMLINLFYAVGVLMRAYENLFSPRPQRTA